MNRLNELRFFPIAVSQKVEKGAEVKFTIWILFENLQVFEGLNDVKHRALVQFQLLGNFTDTKGLF